MAEAKAKILGYKLGNPKTYIPNPKFEVTSRFVEPFTPKPRQTVFFNWKPADPKPMHTPTPNAAKRSNSKTVTKPRAVVHVVNVRVCACGTPISHVSKGMCRTCANKARNTGMYTTVCPICEGSKNKNSQLCRPCAIAKRQARGWTT